MCDSWRNSNGVKKKYLSLAVDYRTYFFRNKIPWCPPEGEGLRLSYLMILETEDRIIHWDNFPEL